MDWRPSASLDQLRERADLLALLRAFFQRRGVMEVETPVLCSSGVTDPAIEPLVVAGGDVLSAPRYLQTSPEYRCLKVCSLAKAVPAWMSSATTARAR